LLAAPSSGNVPARMGLLIILRVVLSVSASAIQKRLLLNRAGINATWILTYGCMLLPAAILASARWSDVDARFWRDILIGGGLDAFGNLAMVAALRGTDLSIFGPLNAIRPIVALLFGWFFLAENPTPIGLLGIGITVAGGVLLFTGSEREEKHHFAAIWKSLVLRILGLSLGVAGAVFLKRAATVATAEVTVAAWIVCGLIVLLGFAVVRDSAALQNLRPAVSIHWKWLLIHSAVFLTMQVLTIYIFQKTLLAYSFVFFQLGMVLQVFVGRFFFREGAFVRRLIASIIMALGSILILSKG
jgi:drug/metabolite transporter (DMT)-like permease